MATTNFYVTPENKTHYSPAPQCVLHPSPHISNTKEIYNDTICINTNYFISKSPKPQTSPLRQKRKGKKKEEYTLQITKKNTATQDNWPINTRHTNSRKETSDL
jgi:hypothetical protein